MRQNEFTVLVAILMAIFIAGIFGCQGDRRGTYSINERWRQKDTYFIITVEKWYGGFAAEYRYFYSDIWERWLSYLDYKNSQGDTVSLRLNDRDEVMSIWIADGELRQDEPYICSWPENLALCEKVAQKVAEWRQVIKWHERITAAKAENLKQEQEYKPREHLD